VRWHRALKSHGEQVCLLDTAHLAVIEWVVQHPQVPVELVYLLSRRWGNLEELFHRAVVSEGASSDALRKFGEDRVKEERSRFQALVNNLLGPISLAVSESHSC
jgi:hypothetical protein